MSAPLRPGWNWFPSDKTSWSLDVVTLLAVIGESSVAQHAQTITASWLCLLPRLIPAPQALLKSSRLRRMPEASAKVAGVYGGTTLDSVGFFATVIVPLGEIPRYTLKVVSIKHAVPLGQDKPEEITGNGTGARQGGEHYGASGAETPPNQIWATFQHLFGSCIKQPVSDPETGREKTTPETKHGDAPPGGESHNFQRQNTLKEKLQDKLVAGLQSDPNKPLIVPVQLFSPIHILTVLSFALSVAILVMAIVWNDAVAILAIVLMSLVSSIVGLASRWEPVLTNRTHNNSVPDGDVMIRTREGGFLLVKCTEEVARELFSGTEECKYAFGEPVYMVLMALATMMLMVSVVLLGNCTWNSKVFIGTSFILLNGPYWGLGMLKPERFWDLSRYVLKNETNEGENGGKVEPSFTLALWHAIRETKSTDWVKNTGAAPNTGKWKEWLKEALKNARENNRNWAAVDCKNKIMDGENRKNNDAQSIEGIQDTPVEHMPKTEA